MRHEHDTQQLLNELDNKQSPVTWPETVNAGRAVDEFLWKGDPKAKLVQRVGLAIFAAIFLGFSVIAGVLIVVKRDATTTAMCGFLGSLCGIAGVRFLRNTFRRQTHHQNRR